MRYLIIIDYLSFLCNFLIHLVAFTFLIIWVLFLLDYVNFIPFSFGMDYLILSLLFHCWWNGLIACFLDSCVISRNLRRVLVILLQATSRIDWLSWGIDCSFAFQVRLGCAVKILLGWTFLNQIFACLYSHWSCCHSMQDCSFSLGSCSCFPIWYRLDAKCF